MGEKKKTRGRALDDSVSRAIRDNLLPLQRSIEELQQAYADLVSACASTRPSNALPAMVRAQACSASVSASLSVLSNFITSVMQRPGGDADEEDEPEAVSAIGVEVAHPAAAPEMPPREISKPMAHAAAPTPAEIAQQPETVHFHTGAVESAAPAEEISEDEELQATSPEEIASEPDVEEAEAGGFDIASLPADERDMHKRADRVAKVSMQDIKMLKPEDVRKGREHKDICVRLRNEIDKARKEYDRRFQKILDHPVDHFHHWLVQILGDGDPGTLGEYPYPSPVLRR